MAIAFYASVNIRRLFTLAAEVPAGALRLYLRVRLVSKNQ